MNPTRLQNKIERLLVDLHAKHPKKSVYTWQNWAISRNGGKVLKDHKATYINGGASRIAIGIKHAGKEYVFKICYDECCDDVLDFKADDDNHAEIIAVKKMNKSIWVRSLILPLIMYYKSPLAGWISVWPKAEEYDYFPKEKEKDQKYNTFRRKLMRHLTSDDHEGNIAYWKGHLWLIDLNINNTEDSTLECVKNKHKKQASNHIKSYRETSRLVKFTT